MKPLKIWFSDFDANFKVDDNYIFHLLAPYYSLELDSENPDFLIYSCYGNDFLKYNCVRIFYTAENLIPDFNLCDYAIGFAYIDFQDRYLRFPYFALFKDQFENLITKPKFDESIFKEKQFFCNFIYANSNAHPARDHFFHLLNKYREVSSPGKHLNNMSFDVGQRFAQDWMYSKISFQSKCKFTISFENTSAPGYTTEKILHAFNANSIPIYWGNPEVTKDFNPKSFINCHDYNNFEEAIIRIKNIDANSNLYLSMLNEPALKNNVIPVGLTKNKLFHFLEGIFKSANPYKRSTYGTQLKYEKDLKANLEAKRKLKKLSRVLNIFKI